MKKDFFNFTTNLALQSIEGAINLRHPFYGTKTFIFIPKKKEALIFWENAMEGLKTNDKAMNLEVRDFQYEQFIDAHAFVVGGTKNHYVISANLDHPNFPWSGLVAAYAQENHSVINFRDNGQITPENFQTILDNISDLIESDKQQKHK